MLLTERRLRTKHGTEGPAYDPYAKDEYIVTINGVIHNLIMGLGIRYLVDGVEAARDYIPYDEEYVVSSWESAVGMTLETFDKAEHRINGPPTKCRHCGSRNFEYFGGYVGETMMGCGSCHEILWCEEVTDAMIA